MDRYCKYGGVNNQSLASSDDDDEEEEDGDRWIEIANMEESC